MTTSSLTLRTPAKINPVLEILSKRQDGFHELALVFQAVSLYDELSFELVGGDVALSILGSPAPLATDGSNLIVKAARLFLHEACLGPRGVSIRLEKRIPLAAGLGGGSSDAAATLLGLNELFGAKLGQERLKSMAAQLGSDVAFFLSGGSALGRGRGEQITPWGSCPSIDLVLVKPPQGLSTPAVYGSGLALLTSGEKAESFADVLAQGDPGRYAENLLNGLEPAAFHLEPETARLKEELRKAGALGALVSGSGPTVFGVASSAAHASGIAAKLEGKGRAVFVVRTIASGVQML